MAIYNQGLYSQQYRLVIFGVPVNNVAGNANLSANSGLIMAAGVPISNLPLVGAPASTYGFGTFGFFDPDTNLSLSSSSLPCCDILIAAASPYKNDFISPHLGGLQMPFTKVINPKRIKKAFRINYCPPQNSVIHIGNTNVTPNDGGSSPVATGGLIGVNVISFSGAFPASSTGCLGLIVTGQGSGGIVDVIFVPDTDIPVSINTPGSGYTVGDVLTLTFTGGCTVTVKVTAVTSTGAITQAQILGYSCPAGALFSTGTTPPVISVSATGGTGTGAVIGITLTPQLVVNDPGAGYQLGETFTVACGSLNITGQVTSTAQPDCCKEFFCGQTYVLRVDIIGTKAFRNFHHRIHQDVVATTSCCPSSGPTEADPTLVMIQWAEGILSNPYLGPFIFPVVYDYTGQAWYPPQSLLNQPPYGYPPINPPFPIPSGQTWDLYPSSGAGQNWSPGSGCAGLRLEGAYTDTEFQNCSFHPHDVKDPEPVIIKASLVDFNGDPCFDGLCVIEQCAGHDGQGYGDTVLKNVLLNEVGKNFGYVFDYDDPRYREILGTQEIINQINRSAMYYRYSIIFEEDKNIHSGSNVERDQFEIVIWTQNIDPSLETAINGLLNCNGCGPLEVIPCTQCPEIGPGELPNS